MITKFRDIFIVLFFLFCYLVIFAPGSRYIRRERPLLGIIYDVGISTSNVQNVSGEKPVIFSNENKLPTMNIYSELNIPESFVVKTVKSKVAADYILVSEKLLEKKFVFDTKLNSKKNTKDFSNAVTHSVRERKGPRANRIRKENTHESPVDYHTLQNIVTKSEKNFYFPDIKTISSNVELRLVSFTPFEKNKGILKFTISNNSKDYFFLGPVGISFQDDNIPTDFFGPQYLAPQKTSVMFCLLRKIPNKKDLTMTVTESGGKSRCLKIRFSLT